MLQPAGKPLETSNGMVVVSVWLRTGERSGEVHASAGVCHVNGVEMVTVRAALAVALPLRRMVWPVKTAVVLVPACRSL